MLTVMTMVAVVTMMAAVTTMASMVRISIDDNRCRLRHIALIRWRGVRSCRSDHWWHVAARRIRGNNCADWIAKVRVDRSGASSISWSAWMEATTWMIAAMVTFSEVDSLNLDVSVNI